MNNWIYLDCFCGIAGDMFLAALLDLGLSKEKLKKELNKLSFEEISFKLTETDRCGIRSKRFEVMPEEDPTERSLEDIRDIFEKSELKERVKTRALNLFQSLAEAESAVHGTEVEDIHFHELGALDSIVDITGAVAALDLLGIDRVFCSFVPFPGGEVETRHGSYPVPAPATAELLKDVPIRASGIEGEIVTPTGAVLIKELTDEFLKSVPEKYENCGYGAGSKDFPDRPNILRIFSGSTEKDKSTTGSDIMSIKFNVDDENPENLGYLMDKLLEEGAADVFFTPVIMKKNRPGTEVNVLTRKEEFEKMCEIIFRETSTIGLRYCTEQRKELDREISKVETPYGPVDFKISYYKDGKRKTAEPEHNDCRKIALEESKPLREIKLELKKHFKNSKE